MVTNVLFALLAIFCFAGMLEYKKRADKAESYARNAHRLYRQSYSIIDSLNAEISKLNDQLNAALRKNVILQQTIYDQTVKLEGSQYTLPMMPAKKQSSNNVNGNNGSNNGKGNDNGNNKTQPVQSAQSNPTATLAGMGTLSDDEKRKVSNWQSKKYAESDMCKWLQNMRNNANKAKVSN